MALSPQADDRVLSVGELTRAIKETLNDGFPAVWVKGELSNFKRHDSGHLYFALKEGTLAVLSCAMFRGNAGKLSFEPSNGTEVEAFGEIDVYAPRGNYQLIVRQMRPAGLGALLLQLEELKRRLSAEGLFDLARKRPLPVYPRTIGVVTSPVGAAVRDVIKVLRARWPGIRIVLAPVKVQGPGAGEEIAAGIARFNRWGGADLLIVGRGGGSLEDLWAFNEEPVVRAIANSAIPVISAVGHEVDTTLADLAADVRAATPSNAAEIAVRDASQIADRVAGMLAAGTRAVTRGVTDRRRRLAHALQRYPFRRARDVIHTWQQRIDDARGRLDDAVRRRLDDRRERSAALSRAYGLREFPRRIARHREGALGLGRRLDALAVGAVLTERKRVIAIEDRLRALSPRAVMERGYALVRARGGGLLRGADALATGDRVTIEFARGEADAVIEALRTGGRHGEEDRRG